MKLFIVTGEHFDVPNTLQSVHFDRPGADAKALHLVNLIRADVPADPEQPDEQTPALPALKPGSDWEAGLAEAQKIKAEWTLGFPLSELDLSSLRGRELDDPDLLAEMSECYVQIVEMEAEGAVPGIAEAVAPLIDYAANSPDIECGEGYWDDQESACFDGQRQERSTAAAIMRTVLESLGITPPVGVEVCTDCYRDADDDHHPQCQAPEADEDDAGDYCSKCGADLASPSSDGAEDGVCGECIGGDALPSEA